MTPNVFVEPFSTGGQNEWHIVGQQYHQHQHPQSMSTISSALIIIIHPVSSIFIQISICISIIREAFPYQMCSFFNIVQKTFSHDVVNFW